MRLADIKVGDRLRIVRRIEEIKGWHNSWTDGMDEYVGREFTVTAFDSGGVRFLEVGYGWPAEALERATPQNLSEACAAYTRACEAFEAAQGAVERAKLAVADARIDVERALEGEP